MVILFVDIETAPEHKEFKDLSLDGQKAFAKKFSKRVESGEYPSLDAIYEAETALYAEFSKIVCIGIGSILLPDAKVQGSTESIYAKALIGDEVKMLENFASTCERVKPDLICAHNGKKFDFPFIIRRMLIHGIPLPSILNVGSAKPWEVKWLDTVTEWQATDMKYYVSLITLAYVFGLPSPKEELEGAEVPKAYYDGRIQDIAKYCLNDVATLINVYRRITFQTSIDIIKSTIQPL